MPVPPKDPNPPPSQGGSPQITTQDWNDLVDGAILKDRTTDQSLLSNLEITGADKKFIAGDGFNRGFYLKNSGAISRGLGKIIGSGATESMEVMELFGSPAFKQVPGFSDIDYSGHTARSIILGDLVSAPIFSGNFLGFTSGFGFITRADSIGTNLKFPIFTALETLGRKFGGLNEFGGNIQAVGIPSPTRILEGVGAGVSSITDGEGNWSRYTTGNVSGNRAGFKSAAFDMFRRSSALTRPFFGVRLKKLTPFTSIRLWIVLTSAEISATDDPTSAHLMGLRYSTTTDTDLKAVSKDGTTLNVQDFASPGVINIAFLREILIVFLGNLTNPTIVVSDGNQYDSATLTTNLPGTGINLGFQATIETKTAASRSFDIQKLGFLQS